VEFDGFVTGAIRDNHTTLLGRPFDFSPGDHNGSERVTVLRWGQELTLRGQRNAFSACSTVSFGLPWFDATRNRGLNPGGDFVAWLGQGQFVHAIAGSDVQLVVKGAVQASDRPLLTLEQFALGGVESVRGYPENHLVRDEGATGSIELHIPIWQKNGLQVLTLIPFLDAGAGWNRHERTGPSEILTSPGIGITFTPNSHISLAVFYGVPLQHLAHSTHDPQDLGLHFSLLVLAF